MKNHFYQTRRFTELTCINFLLARRAACARLTMQ